MSYWHLPMTPCMAMTCFFHHVDFANFVECSLLDNTKDTYFDLAMALLCLHLCATAVHLLPVPQCLLQISISKSMCLQRLLAQYIVKQQQSAEWWLEGLRLRFCNVSLSGN